MAGVVILSCAQKSRLPGYHHDHRWARFAPTAYLVPLRGLPNYFPVAKRVFPRFAALHVGWRPTERECWDRCGSGCGQDCGWFRHSQCWSHGRIGSADDSRADWKHARRIWCDEYFRSSYDLQSFGSLSYSLRDYPEELDAEFDFASGAIRPFAHTSH